MGTPARTPARRRPGVVQGLFPAAVPVPVAAVAPVTRPPQTIGTNPCTRTTKAHRRYRDHLWTFAVYRSPVDV